MSDTISLGAGSRPTARRIIAASASDLFDAWVTPGLVEDWWGPEGYTMRVRELDARPGGRYAFEMIAPSGKSCIMAGVYRTVIRPEHLIFEVHDHCNLDLPEGTRAQTATSLVEVTFDERDGETVVSVTHTGLNDDYGWLAIASWAQSLERLSRDVV